MQCHLAYFTTFEYSVSLLGTKKLRMSTSVDPAFADPAHMPPLSHALAIQPMPALHRFTTHSQRPEFVDRTVLASPRTSKAYP